MQNRRIVPAKFSQKKVRNFLKNHNFASVAFSRGIKFRQHWRKICREVNKCFMFPERRISNLYVVRSYFEKKSMLVMRFRISRKGCLWQNAEWQRQRIIPLEKEISKDYGIPHLCAEWQCGCVIATKSLSFPRMRESLLNAEWQK